MQPFLVSGNILKSGWQEFKYEVRRVWSEVRDEELERTRGNVRAVWGLIQDKVGLVQEDSKRKLHALIAKAGIEPRVQA